MMENESKGKTLLEIIVENQIERLSRIKQLLSAKRQNRATKNQESTGITLEKTKSNKLSESAEN